jgi:hypothetical protein
MILEPLNRLFLVFFLLMLIASPAFAAPASPPTLGAYYFDGWTSTSTHLRPRLLTEFADRQPVWGWHDDSLTTVEIQIDYAADAGLRFFAFDWYYPEGPDKYSPLNTGLDFYLRASNRDRLQFCLLVANHSGFRIGPADWTAVCDLWLPLLAHPQHLRTRGRPLIIFFAPGELLNAFGSPQALRAAFDALQARARAAGLPGVEIAACATPGPENNWNNLNALVDAGFTCLTGYNYVGHPRKGPEMIQAYSTLIAGHVDIWNRFAAKDVLPYIPVVTAGWDSRPWEAPTTTTSQSLYYPDRTPTQFAQYMKEAEHWLTTNPTKTLPERIILIYAWNEYGEGGYIAPTLGTGTLYLDSLP